MSTSTSTIPSGITAHVEAALKHLTQADIKLSIEAPGGAENKGVRAIKRVTQTIEHSTLSAGERGRIDPTISLVRVTAHTSRAEVRFILAQALVELATYEALLSAWVTAQQEQEVAR